MHGNNCRRKEKDSTGEVTEENEATGELYFYNSLGWLMESRTPQEYRDGAVYYQLIRYEYDLAGNRIKGIRYQDYQTKESQDGEIHTISYEYDKEDRLVRVSDCTGAVLQYGYDGKGRRTLEKRKINQTAEQVFRYFYDEGGRIIRVLRSADQEGCGKEAVSVRYEYDKNGNNTRVLLPSGGEIFLEYDVADRLIKETHKEKKSGIDNTTCFAYDKAGNLICITDNQGWKTEIEYDLLNREIRPEEYEKSKDNGAGSGASFQYDLGGRRTRIETKGKATQSYAYGNITGLCDGAGNRTEYILDKWGRITEIRRADGSNERYGYDYAGNITESVDGESNRTTYEYNAANLLFVLTDPAGEMEQYQYDEEGQLCRKTDRNGTETTFTYNLYGNGNQTRSGSCLKNERKTGLKNAIFSPVFLARPRMT